MSTAPEPASLPARPRIEGEREQEILHAALDVLTDLGYDRLTMDAVAARARASKATLYRRWSGKAQLVIDAMLSLKEPESVPDTGSLRDDVVALYCGRGGLTEQRSTALLAAVITAVGRDAEFARAFRERFVGPKVASAAVVFDRAVSRGEIPGDIDVAFLGPVLPAVVLHRVFLLGEEPDAAFIERVVDDVLMPAVHAGCAQQHRPHPEPNPIAHPHQTSDSESKDLP